MSASSPRRTPLIASAAGLAAVAVAAFFGLDLTGNDAYVDKPVTSESPSNPGDHEARTSISDLDQCSLAELPSEASDTADDIRAGGPYQFPDNDDTRFGNYERVLPDEPLGYYREYTVVTPGINHRGARRIVTGGESSTHPEVWYYTADHYESFCEIYDADQ